MIVILKRIKTSYKGEDVIIPPGEYDKVPLELRNDSDFMHYVMSKGPNGNPDYIKGYKPTKEELEKYKPLVKSASKGEARVLKPNGEKVEETKKQNIQTADGKNKA